jgi:hypothetical protein
MCPGTRANMCYYSLPRQWGFVGGGVWFVGGGCMGCMQWCVYAVCSVYVHASSTVLYLRVCHIAYSV